MIPDRRGDLMVSALVSRLSGKGSSPGRGTLRCVLEQHFTLTALLSTHGLNLIQGRVEILLVASCYKNRDKLPSDGLLGSYADFTSYSKQSLLWPLSREKTYTTVHFP